MAAVATFNYNPLVPIHSPGMAILRHVQLPVGGPVGVGGIYRKGTVLGAVTSVTPVDEVWLLTVTGSPTGWTGSFTYANGGATGTATLPNLVTAKTTAAQMQTALESIFGVGQITVAFADPVYTLTFAGGLAKKRIGGLLTPTWTFTAGTTPAVARTTSVQGSAGIGQYDAYDDSKSDGTQTARAILKYDWATDASGGRISTFPGASTPQSPEVYVSGHFRAGDLVGLDAAAVADPGWRVSEGTLFSNAEATISLGV